jgi:hypothetical protein
MTIGTTVLDNTAGGTTTFTGGQPFSGATTSYAYSFTTGNASTWSIQSLRVAMANNDPDPMGMGSPDDVAAHTLTISLFALAGDLTPTGAALATATYGYSVDGHGAYFLLGAVDLGSIASYTMAASTGYALAFNDVGAAMSIGSMGDFPAAGSGFVVHDLLHSSDSTSWDSYGNAYGVTPLFSLAVAPTCFLRGTLIMTSRGEVRVEALKAGDLLATKFGGLRAVTWIGTQCFEGRLAGVVHQPIRFARGSLGGGMPSCDLFVSPGHAMLVQGVLAHAGALENGATITQGRVRGQIEYFHLDLGPHDCVLANGAWAETYFEDHNRDAFHNAGDFHALFPGHVSERQANCLPIVTASDPRLPALRASLAPARCATPTARRAA